MTSSRNAWQELADHLTNTPRVSLREQFDTDPDRSSRFTVQAADLRFDYSKHLIDDQVMRLLREIADESSLADRRAAMFSGAKINETESRSVLHVALRSPGPIYVDGEDVCAAVNDVLAKMRPVAMAVRDQQWLGATGKPIRNIVNIGIGGSDLGPVMCTRALRHLCPSHLSVRFVSNVDGAHLDEALDGLEPDETLFVVASKTFTTIETMTNAESARTWITSALGTDPDVVKRHFVALSTNSERVADFGIDTDNMFGFWDWVGGRYSVASAIGFSLMCAIGPDGFDEFRAGMASIDDHFVNAPTLQNAPVVSALLSILYRNFYGWQTQAVLPYSQALDRFPAYLQQLEMESNGKRVRHDGSPCGYDTAPVIWGEPGTNGQHAFFQLLHQGTTPVPADLIGFYKPEPATVEGIDRPLHHRLLFANMVAQSEALAFGKTSQEVAESEPDPVRVSHRTFPGDRPTTVITAPALTPSVLGQLIALYEHRVFTQGAIWDINSFDQWGVELGKVLALRIADTIDSGDTTNLDASTAALINEYRRHN